MFDAPSAAEEDKLLFGSIGIVHLDPCQKFGFVTSIEVISIAHECHGCPTCQSLQFKFGTCEYVLPEYCKCHLFDAMPRASRSQQSTLPIPGYKRVRLTFQVAGLRKTVFRQFHDDS